MKQNLKSLVFRVLVLTSTLVFTSCEGALDDIFGEWDKPSGGAVTPSGGGGPAPSLTLNAANLRFVKTDLTAQTLTATVTSSDATITWSSDKESVATVDATGKVTPVALGKATITAKAGDLVATSTVYVYDQIIDISTASSPISVTTGESWLIKGDKNTPVAKSITIGDGASVTLMDVNITNQIFCNGDATIILADGATNTVNVSADHKAGIQIGGTATTLIIDAETAGDGQLTVKGGKFAAGIGTGFYNNYVITCGKITINGGTVTATGGDCAAGIGTALVLTHNITCGDITINGGTVKATGALGGAGIGTGRARENHTNTCGAIKINGGTINATGTGGGAGIGTGYADGTSGTTKNECGNITINVGTVTAKGGNDAAGIGTGYANNTSGTAANQECGAITIGAGVTSVTAIQGAGCSVSIGTGNLNGTGSQTCGTITIDPSANVEY